MSKIKTRIIPDRIFYKIVKLSERFNSEEEFNTSFTIGEPIFNYKRYNLQYDEYIFLILEIYRRTHQCLFDIAKESDMRKCDISNIYCIPIRTVEDWYSQRTKCPVYIKMMILKDNHLLNLGKYIKLQSQVIFEGKTPKIYNTTNKNKGQEHIEYDYEDNSFAEDETEQINEYNSFGVSELLSKTDYLKR